MATDLGFLRAVYEQSQAEMRRRSDIEYRLVTIQVSVLAFLIPAQGFVYGQIVNRSSQMGALGGIVLFILSLAAAVSWKIKSEHEVYKAVGATVVRLWEYFEMFKPDAYAGAPMLPEQAREYGKGPGYKKTIAVLWLLSGGGVIASVLMGLSI
jgi:hypothetical protein